MGIPAFRPTMMAAHTAEQDSFWRPPDVPLASHAEHELDSVLERWEDRFAAVVRREVLDVFDLKLAMLRDTLQAGPAELPSSPVPPRQPPSPVSAALTAAQPDEGLIATKISFRRIRSEEIEIPAAAQSDASPAKGARRSVTRQPSASSVWTNQTRASLQRANRGSLDESSSSNKTSVMSVHKGAKVSDSQYLQMARLKSRQQESTMGEDSMDLMLGAASRRSWRESLRRIIATGSFETFWFFMILGNSALLGVQVEMEAHRSAGAEVAVNFQIANSVFTIVFVVELVLRMFGDGSCYRFFLKSPNRVWHWFDTFIVSATTLDLFLTILVGSLAANARSLRLLRVMRILRAARSLKLVQHIAPLRRLLQSIMGTLRTLMWATLLLAILTFVCAIVFTDAITTALQDPHSGLDRTVFFGGLWSSMIILFWAVVGGTDCWPLTLELLSAGGGWCVLFVVYVAIGIMAVMNVMTAIFCQSAIDNAAKDTELVMSAFNESRANLAADLERLFTALRGRHGNEITLDGLMKDLQDKWIQDFFTALEVDVTDVLTLFKLLDRTGDGLLDASEFVEGCMKIRGTAKAIDLIAIKWDVKALRDQLQDLVEGIGAEVHVLQEKMEELTAALALRPPEEPNELGA